MEQNKLWEYYQTQGIESFDASFARLRFLVKQLPARSRVLNIGIGAGKFEEYALEGGHDVYALDPIEKALVSLRERLHLGNKAQVGYGQAIPFESNFFDVVVVSEVLEHLSPEIMHTTLTEIHRVLRKGGLILGTVPARENYHQQIVVCPHCGEIFHRWGHLQTFTMQQMQMNLEKNQFTMEKLTERQFITWSYYGITGKMLGIAKVALRYVGIHSSGEHMFFKARK